MTLKLNNDVGKTENNIFLISFLVFKNSFDKRMPKWSLHIFGISENSMDRKNVLTLLVHKNQLAFGIATTYSKIYNKSL